MSKKYRLRGGVKKKLVMFIRVTAVNPSGRKIAEAISL